MCVDTAERGWTVQTLEELDLTEQAAVAHAAAQVEREGGRE